MAGPSPRSIAKASIDAAHAFLRERPWSALANEECVAVRVPGHSHPLVASVMGRRGMEFGLVLYLGERAIADCRAFLLGRTPEEMELVSFLSFTVTTLTDIPPDMRGVFRLAGLTPRRTDRVPLFLVKEAHQQPRAPTPKELRALLQAIQAVRRAHAAGVLAAGSIHEADTILTLKVEGGALDPIVTWTEEPLPRPDPPELRPLSAARLTELPRSTHRWLVGYPGLPTRVHEDSRSVRALVILESTSGRCARLDSLLGDAGERAVELILEALNGAHQGFAQGLPQEVVFTSRELFERLGPALAEADVPCRLVEGDPEMAEFVDGLADSLEYGGERERGHGA